MDPHLPQLATIASLAGRSNWRLALQHSRPQPMIFWLTKAQGQAVVRGRRLRVSTGSLLYLPADTLFSLDIGAQGFGTAMSFPQDTDAPLPADPHHLRVRQAQAHAELVALIEAMQREQTRGGDFHGEAARAHAALLSVWLRRAVLAAPEPAAAAVPAADARLAARFADRVAQDYRSGRPMSAYAEALHVTPTHLSRSCKSASGLSAAGLLAQRNLHAARTLLAETDHGIARIAAHLGFGSAAAFTRFIRRHTGLTPSQLRGRKAVLD